MGLVAQARYLTKGGIVFLSIKKINSGENAGFYFLLTAESVFM
jgi:hypothetical protein